MQHAVPCATVCHQLMMQHWPLLWRLVTPDCFVGVLTMRNCFLPNICRPTEVHDEVHKLLLVFHDPSLKISASISFTIHRLRRCTTRCASGWRPT